MHRSYNKIHVIADSSPNAQAAKRSIIKKYKNYPINDSDVFIVLGGDGFMLASLKKYQKYKIPFYGMNKGNRGFLLNRFDEKDLINKINKAILQNFIPLKCMQRIRMVKLKQLLL
jgi:NAD+ kinase